MQHSCHMIYFRLRAQSIPFHHASGFSKSLEAIDSTKLPPEPDMSEDGNCIELNEIQADKYSENNFTDTTLTG